MRRRHHCAQVMCAVVAQWHFLHVGAVGRSYLAQRLEGRVGYHQTRLRAVHTMAARFSGSLEPG